MYLYIYIYIHTHVYTYVCIYIYRERYNYRYRYIYIYIHIYIYTSLARRPSYCGTASATKEKEITRSQANITSRNTKYRKRLNIKSCY